MGLGGGWLISDFPPELHFEIMDAISTMRYDEMDRQTYLPVKMQEPWPAMTKHQVTVTLFMKRILKVPNVTVN